MHTPILIAALFIITEISKPSKCPLTDEGTEKMLYVYKGVLFSHEKNEILPFAVTWMDLEGIKLSEISQTEKDKYCIISLICGI